MNTNYIIAALIIAYVIYVIYVALGLAKTRKLSVLHSGTLGNKDLHSNKDNDEKRAFLKTRMSNNDHYLKLSFWATFISGVVSLCFSSAILFKFSFLDPIEINELIKLITCITSFSFAGIFAFLISEFNKMKIGLIREFNKIPS